MTSNETFTIPSRPVSEQLEAARELLDTEREALLRVIESVPESERARRARPDGWSLVELMEHLARVEKGVARLLEVKGREAPEPSEHTQAAERATLTPAAVASLRSRAERRQVPERVAPSGTSSPAQALEAMREMRAALLRAIDAASPDALRRVVHDHVSLGTLNLAAWIEFVAHHEARHAEQAAEIAAALRDSSGGGA